MDTVHCFVIKGKGWGYSEGVHTTIYKCKLKTVKILQHLPVTILIYTLSHAWNILTNVDNIIQGIILSQNLNNEKVKTTHTTHSIWIIPDRVLIEHYLFQINDVVIPPNEL